MNSLNEEDPDNYGASIELMKEAINIAAFACGAEGIAQPLFEIYDMVMAGSPNKTELQTFSQELKYILDDMATEIDKGFSKLRESLDDSTKIITDTILDAIKSYELSNDIKVFFSAADGNFSYDRFKNAVLGSSEGSVNPVNYQSAYLDKARRAFLSGTLSEDVVDSYYNTFYNALTTDSIFSNISTFYTYLLGSSTGSRPIVQEYYDYLLHYTYRFSEQPESKALNFLYELYLLALRAENAIVATSARLGLSDFQDTYNASIARQKLLETQMLIDACYILGLDQSYIVKDARGNLYEEINNGQESFGQVIMGQTIYLEKPVEAICAFFDVDPSKLQFKAISSSAVDAIDGSLLINKEGIIEVQLLYGESVVYSQKFVVQNDDSQEFCGGDGTLENPYGIHNAIQLQRISEDLEACYKLVGNVQLAGKSITTLRKDYDEEFKGVLDGQGFSIGGTTENHGNIEGYINSGLEKEEIINNGLFAVIGTEGTVCNLVLKNIDATYNFVEKTEQDPLNVGIITGLNCGTIYNCHVENCVPNINKKNQGIDVDIATMINIGGLVGFNLGTICYSSVKKSEIKAESYRFYGSNDDSKNKNFLYAGGICGYNNGILESCLASGIDFHCLAKSEYNYDGNKYPRVEIMLGGITGQNFGDFNAIIANNITFNKTETGGEEATCVVKNKNKSNVDPDDKYIWHFNEIYIAISSSKFSSLKKPKISTAEALGVISNPVSGAIIMGNYHNEVKEYNKKYKNIVEKYRNEVSQKVVDTITFPDINSYNASYVYDANILVGCGVAYTGLPSESFIRIDGVTYTGTLRSYYGFDSNNPSLTTRAQHTMVAIYDLVINGITKEVLVDIDYSVEKNKPYDLYFYDEPSFSNLGLNKEPVVNRASIILEYENGSTTFIKAVDNAYWIDYGKSTAQNITSDVKAYCDTSRLGNAVFYLFYKGIIMEYQISIECNHEHTSFISYPTTCQRRGYKIYTCEDCGYSYTDYEGFEFISEHIYNRDTNEGGTITVNGVEPTCSHYGYTGDTVCSECYSHGIIEIIDGGQGKYIDKLPHTYIFEPEDINDRDPNVHYSNADYHWCDKCGAKELHQFKASEKMIDGKYYYVYTCEECGFEIKDENMVISNYDDYKLPALVVTDGYVSINGEKQVTVYVQLLNCPSDGVSGITFAIKYDERLEWINYKEGSVIKDCTVKPDNYQLEDLEEEMTNIKFFLWADCAPITKSGNVLSITFRVPENVNIGDTFDISVVYTVGHGIGGFSVGINNPKTEIFLTKQGQVTVVEHLPGDVNNDDVVDILDVYDLARYKVYGSYSINEKYADVNLDGKIEISDIVNVLRLLTGDYNHVVMSPDYRVILNAMGGECSTNELYVTVGSTYEGLPTPTRDGYKFLGWYPYCAGDYRTIANQQVGRITADSKVVYYYFQQKQTLYAHWEINQITLSYDEERITFTSTDVNQVTLQKPDSFNKTTSIVYHYNDGSGKTNETQTVQYEVAYWLDQNGQQYDNGIIINLLSNEIGNLVLTPVWKVKETSGVEKANDESINVLVLPKERNVLVGYANSSSSTGDPYIVVSRSRELKVIDKDTIDLYAVWTPIVYTIKYNYSGKVVSKTIEQVTDKYTIENYNIMNNIPVGYEAIGWSTTNGGVVHYKAGDQVSHLSNENGSEINLYLVTDMIKYSIVYERNFSVDPLALSKATLSFDNVTNKVITDSITIPTKSFYGWSITKWESSDKVYSVNAGETITIDSLVSFANENNTITLYAVWDATSLMYLERNIDIVNNQDTYSFSPYLINALYAKGYRKIYVTFRWNASLYAYDNVSNDYTTATLVKEKNNIAYYFHDGTKEFSGSLYYENIIGEQIDFSPGEGYEYYYSIPQTNYDFELRSVLNSGSNYFDIVIKRKGQIILGNFSIVFRPKE